MPLAKELRLDEYSGYILSFNGGRIINCKTGETVFARSLPVSANKKIIGLAEEHQVDIVTYEGSRIISSNPESPYGKLESRINGMELWKPEDMKEYVNFEVPKFLMMEDGDYLAMVEPKVKAAMGKISAFTAQIRSFLRSCRRESIRLRVWSACWKSWDSRKSR